METIPKNLTLKKKFALVALAIALLGIVLVIAIQAEGIYTALTPGAIERLFIVKGNLMTPIPFPSNPSPIGPPILTPTQDPQIFLQ